MNKKGSALVIFGKDAPSKLHNKYDEIIDSSKVAEFVEAGSIYEAETMVQELSSTILPNGTKIAKSFIFRGYELWWMHYSNLFLYFCLPFTQHRKLLEYLRNFNHVTFYNPPYKTLFYYYLEAYGINTSFITSKARRSFGLLPFGVFEQIILTLISLPFLIIARKPIMVFVGDKFETGKDYDFRMKFIYRELRSRNLRFIECIRSLEPWKTVLKHFFVVRKRPVIYSEAIAYLGKFASFLTLGRSRLEAQLDFISSDYRNAEKGFMLNVASHYLRDVYSDVWSIRIMAWIMAVCGVRVAYITSVMDRNFHAFLGSKLNFTPTIGILHGVASYYYNVYDFLPGFDGKNNMQVDKYGLWSDWWREYYIKHSKAFRTEQLYVSGPMRPLEKPLDNLDKRGGAIKVLFVSEQLAVPEEVIPYLEALLKDENIIVSLTFRPYRDSFRDWLATNRPQLLEHPNISIVENDFEDAIRNSEIAVGTMSTAVLEMLLAEKTPIFFHTNKWGDYFNLKGYGNGHPFFASSPEELVVQIGRARSILRENIKTLKERYFGEPNTNGSVWVVDQLEEVLKGWETR